MEGGQDYSHQRWNWDCLSKSATFIIFYLEFKNYNPHNEKTYFSALLSDNEWNDVMKVKMQALCQKDYQ